MHTPPMINYHTQDMAGFTKDWPILPESRLSSEEKGINAHNLLAVVEMIRSVGIQSYLSENDWGEQSPLKRAVFRFHETMPRS